MAIKAYYQLVKPGIVYANAMAAAAGFFLASRGHVVLLRLVAVLVGTSLVVAAGCVFNNYIDREIDKKMKRTKKRALVSGLVSGRKALLYGVVLVLVGFAALVSGTNWQTVGVGLLGLIFYVVVYSFGKRR